MVLIVAVIVIVVIVDFWVNYNFCTVVVIRNKVVGVRIRSTWMNVEWSRASC